VPRAFSRRSILVTTAGLPALAVGTSIFGRSSDAAGAPLQLPPGKGPALPTQGGRPTPSVTLKPRQFLEQKLRETISECAVPALAAVLVRDRGDIVVSAQQGVRKLGASGEANQVQPTDKFNLGSVSKVFTGNLIGKLIQDGVGDLGWTSRIADVYASIWDNPLSRDGYKDVTVEQLIAHTSGMPYTPASDDVDDFEKYTADDMTKTKLRARRRLYIKNAVLDKPEYSPPNSGFVYSGGGIIAASMFEYKTGSTYEDLLKEHIFDPLGMSDSATGRTAKANLDGPWQHAWDPATMKSSPDPRTHMTAFDWHCRAPVGGVCMSAADMGKFIREQVRDDPKLFSKSTREMLQTHRVSAASDTVRGGWVSSNPGSENAVLWHTGDIEVAYASLVVNLAERTGSAAMSNTNSTFSGPAAAEMIEVTRAMHDNWDSLFGSGSPALVECVHPMPALARAGNKLWFFARTHEGKVHRRRSKDAGTSWEALGDFGAVTMNSGLAADASSDGKHIYMVGRGLDNRMWFCSSHDAGATWQGSTPIEAGVFITGPAVVVDATGQKVRVFGIGNDRKMWRAHTDDGGKTWIGWSPIGAGVFTSAPAAAASSDGKVIHVFGRGDDMRCWRNVSTDGGETFEPHWSPIGKGIFTSSLAACASSDGETVHVLGRGTDRAMWRNASSDKGGTWKPHWLAIEGGVFSSAPALACSDNALELHVLGFGTDFRVYGTRSGSGAVDWAKWTSKGPQVFL
jgi:CubicO group peptidase (beta-lactamase class C family)